jgi:hypothetical protein
MRSMSAFGSISYSYIDRLKSALAVSDPLVTLLLQFEDMMHAATR